MSRKTAKIDALLHPFQGQALPAEYLAFFDCFNRQLFFEAHEVLEHRWLPARGSEDDAFYKGLIQLAGAFVHLQKERLRPAAALFRLADANLARYGPRHHQLDLDDTRQLIDGWLRKLEKADAGVNPYRAGAFPELGVPKLHSETISSAT